MFDEFVYQFTLPCTISLSSRPSNEEELRSRLAAALRAQLNETYDADTGSVLQNIRLTQ